MIANRNSEYCQPLTWIGRFPVYLATAIAMGLGICMLLTAVVMAVGGGLTPVENPFLRPLVFISSQAIGEGKVWQFVSYLLVNKPDFMPAIQILLLAMFGAEVEKFIGRRSFAMLFGILTLAMPLFFLGAWYLFKIPVAFSGGNEISFAVFAAFVLIYPRAEIFFGIEARWILSALLVINSMMLLSVRAWADLGALWWMCCVAALWLAYEGVGNFSLPSPRDYFRRKHSEKNLRVAPSERRDVEAEVDIDPILEKIARHGIGSLSRGERDRLEQARAALLEKERGS